MARPMDSCNYVAAKGLGFVAVVDCDEHPFISREDAERAYNALTGDTPAPSHPPGGLASACVTCDRPVAELFGGYAIVGGYVCCVGGCLTHQKDPCAPTPAQPAAPRASDPPSTTATIPAAAAAATPGQAQGDALDQLAAHLGLTRTGTIALGAGLAAGFIAFG